MANTSLSVANINFEDIKSDLQTFLQTQSALKDYDFTGSNLNVLLDVLSYNTFMQNFYLNMVANESFLNSAVLRDSIVSHAKTLNYLPSSYSSAKAVVDISIYPNDTPAQIAIPKHTEFTTSVESNSYIFTTDESITVSADANGNYIASDVEIFEGNIITELFTVSTSNTEQRFVLSNPDVDVNSLTVKVVASASDTSNSQWTRNLNTIGIDGTTNTYFVVPAETGKYEVQFGDGILGRPLENGNIIEAIYRRSDADGPNSANNFALSGNIQGYSNVVIFTRSSAQGGSVGETLDSIKKNASRSLSLQDRTVTVNDYKTLLLQNFNDIEALNVYGGEEAIPPQFGKVLVSVDLKNAEGIPLSRKRDIENFLKLRAPLSIEPRVIDPEFLFVDIITSVRYNPNVTVKSDNEIKSVVQNAIQAHADAEINDFAATLRVSKVSAAIDAADPSILNNDTDVILEKKIIPILGVAVTFVLQFNNEILREIPLNNRFVDGSSPITSTTFTFGGLNGCILRDDGLGKIQIIQQQNATLQIVSPDAGSVNYETGTVTLNSFLVSAFSGDSIKISATPKRRTIKSDKNIILSYNKTPGITIVQERL
jgi:hypothetical protein